MQNKTKNKKLNKQKQKHKALKAEQEPGQSLWRGEYAFGNKKSEFPDCGK